MQLMFAFWLPGTETRNLKDAEQVENLQDQSHLLLGQHIQLVYPNNAARWPDCFLIF